MRIVVATRNKGKVREIRDVFAGPGIELVDLAEFPDAPEVEEDGDTFEANAVKKARELALWCGAWALADDSGLAVDALDGRPGVLSARYAGEPSDPDRNNERLSAEMEGVQDRGARFVCVIALSDPAGEVRTVDGECRGVIAAERRGDGGFGYDPVFVPEGLTQTFAEVSAETKNSMSHRGRALRRAWTAWGDLLRSDPARWG